MTVHRDRAATHVLIVDDDEDVRSTLARLLSQIDLETREAASGREALAAMQADPPELVLLDVYLPDISGYELCRDIRAAAGDDLPIVMISGTKTDGLDRAAGLLLGADDFVVKPFDVDDLRARVRRLLGRERRSRQAPASDHGLTNREVEILGLLAGGKKPGEIAAALFLSPKTVSTHVQHIFAKLGVHSQSQAVAVALRDRLIS